MIFNGKNMNIYLIIVDAFKISVLMTDTGDVWIPIGNVKKIFKSIDYASDRLNFRDWKKYFESFKFEDETDKDLFSKHFNHDEIFIKDCAVWTLLALDSKYSKQTRTFKFLETIDAISKSAKKYNPSIYNPECKFTFKNKN